MQYEISNNKKGKGKWNVIYSSSIQSKKYFALSFGCHLSGIKMGSTALAITKHFHGMLSCEKSTGGLHSITLFSLSSTVATFGPRWFRHFCLSYGLQRNLTSCRSSVGWARSPLLVSNNKTTCMRPSRKKLLWFHEIEGPKELLPPTLHIETRKGTK